MSIDVVIAGVVVGGAPIIYILLLYTALGAVVKVLYSRDEKSTRLARLVGIKHEKRDNSSSKRTSTRLPPIVINSYKS